jgi:hypothetical protein
VLAQLPCSPIEFKYTEAHNSPRGVGSGDVKVC